VRVLRGILLSLLLSLLVGLAIGVALRSRLERATSYIGLAPAAAPLHVAAAVAPVLDAREHEQQVG
jgi:hypothetical protein